MKISEITACIFFLCFTRIIAVEKIHLSTLLNTTKYGDITRYAFETLLETGLDKCIQTCKARKKCKFINYLVRMHSCVRIGIHDSVNVTLEKSLEEKEGYIFGNKSEWNMEEYSPCENCNDHGVCKTRYSKIHFMCKDSGCPYPEIQDEATLLGNQFTAGSKIRYKCKEGYQSYHMQTAAPVCLENGDWNITDVLCLTNIKDCDPNPCLHGGTCTEGTSRFTCTCAPGYNGFICEKPYFECHHWTKEDIAAMDRMGKLRTPEIERKWCEGLGMGYVFTQGESANYPGAGDCLCIKLKTNQKQSLLH